MDNPNQKILIIKKEFVYSMIEIFAIITMILFVVTIGCGFMIHYGGEEFKGGVKGHMVLGVLTFLSFVVLFILIMVN